MIANSWFELSILYSLHKTAGFDGGDTGMQSPFCEQCGNQMELSAVGTYHCLHCGLAYSYQWSLPDGVHVETVICRYSLPDKTEYQKRLAILKEQEKTTKQELGGLGLLCRFWKKKDLRTSLSLLQKQINVIEAYLLSRQSG